MNTFKENQPVYIDEYDYSLPDNRIAKFPLSQRDASKLLVYKNSKISEPSPSEKIGKGTHDS